MNRVTLFAAICLLLSACSIKEDRWECPCWLDVDLGACNGLTDSVNVSAWNPDILFSEDIALDASRGLHEWTVPKGMVTVTTVSAGTNSVLEGGCLLLSNGKACDSLFVHAATVDCTGEFALDSVVLHKQFASVQLTIENIPDRETYPYGLVLRSAFDGLWVTDCSPHKGAWSFPLGSSTDGVFLFRVPRQGDASLVLDLYLDGTLIDTWPIGEHIVKAGYRWTAEDLGDIRIGLDYSRTEPHIIIEPWEGGATYDEVI